MHRFQKLGFSAFKRAAVIWFTGAGGKLQSVGIWMRYISLFLNNINDSRPFRLMAICYSCGKSGVSRQPRRYSTWVSLHKIVRDDVGLHGQEASNVMTGSTLFGVLRAVSAGRARKAFDQCFAGVALALPEQKYLFWSPEPIRKSPAKAVRSFGWGMDLPRCNLRITITTG